MKFVDPTTGADVAEDQIDTHKFRFLAAEDGDRFDFFRTIQPSAGWGVVHGVEVIEYPSAPKWALHVGQVGHGALELTIQKRGLLTATAIGRSLKVVVAAVIDKDASLSLREHTKGVFLERSKRAFGKMPAAVRRECIFDAADWSTLPDPATALQAQHLWVGLVTLGALAEQGTNNAAAVGYTMYAAAGHGPHHHRGVGLDGQRECCMFTPCVWPLLSNRAGGRSEQGSGAAASKVAARGGYARGVQRPKCTCWR